MPSSKHPSKNSVSFVLNEPRNPKNIGASARGMANFGFRDLAVVNPYALAWRETRSAVNASAVVEKAKKFTSLKKALRSAHLVIGTSAGSRRAAEVRWIGLEELQDLVHAHAAAGKRVAIVFGSERSGLSNEDLGYCHYVLKIPTAKDCPSMNLSQAVAVVACAIRPGAFAPGPAKNAGAKNAVEPNVSVEHIEWLVARALKAYTAAGLLKGWTKDRSERRIREAIYRWNLTKVDTAILHSLFGWVLRKRKP
jgi:TrmH family RNA methyltransferase